jgi:hypothetical protein
MAVTPFKYTIHHEDRFAADEILELVDAMDIPPKFVTVGRYSFEAIEILCLLLARFRSAGDLYELTAKYDRSASAISEGVNELVLYLDDKWSFLLDFDKDGVMSPPRLASYAAAIHAAGAPLKSICGFIDCTLRQICRPSLWQRIAYTGHKKYHALKYQAVRLPNGLEVRELVWSC